MWAHLLGYPQKLVEMCGHMLASSYCSRKASTSKRQSVYVTSAPGSVNLKISISNLVGTSRFFSLLPLRPLCLCRWPTVSLAVEYLSESGAPLSGEEGGKPPPPTVVHWNFGGLPRDHAAPVQEVSLASATSSAPEALLACCGALPTTWLEESDPPCSYNWNIMDWVLCPTSQPLAVGGSNRSPPHLHQREEANGKVGRARDPL